MKHAISEEDEDQNAKAAPFEELSTKPQGDSEITLSEDK
jgi:hypothetical protein